MLQRKLPRCNVFIVVSYPTNRVSCSKHSTPLTNPTSKSLVLKQTCFSRVLGICATFSVRTQRIPCPPIDPDPFLHIELADMFHRRDTPQLRSNRFRTHARITVIKPLAVEYIAFARSALVAHICSLFDTAVTSHPRRPPPDLSLAHLLQERRNVAPVQSGCSAVHQHRYLEGAHVPRWGGAARGQAKAPGQNSRLFPQAL